MTSTCILATKFNGVFTNQELKAASLGILVEYQVLVCLHCKNKHENYTVHPQMAARHIKDYHNPLKDPAVTRTAKNVMADYQLPMIPAPPQQIIAPFPFLRLYPRESHPGMQKCMDCPETARFCWTAKTSKSRHYGRAHADIQANRRKAAKAVHSLQSWYSQDSYVQYFEVDKNLLPISSGPCSDQASKRQAAMQAYLNAQIPSNMDSRTVHAPNAKEISPYIAEQGWASHFDGKDTVGLVDIAELPHDPADILYRLRELCGDFFADLDTLLATINPKLLELAVNAGPNGCRQVPFGSVGKSAKRRYGYFMTRFLAALIRSCDKEYDENEPKEYVPFLTAQQRLAAQELSSLLKREKQHADKLRGIQSLLTTCFVPGSGQPEDCEYLCHDKHKDFVYAFCAIYSVNLDGSFKQPEQIVSVTSALQYIIRATVLKQVVILAGELGGIVKSFDKLRYFLDQDHITPFGNLKALRKRMVHHEAVARRIGKLHWHGDDSDHCHFKGKDVSMDSVKQMARASVESVKKLLNIVLRGLSLEDLSAEQLDNLDLYDTMTETAGNYSFVNDSRNNVLTQLSGKLVNVFIKGEAPSGTFWDGETVDENNLPIWDDGERKKWLRDVGELSFHLAVAMHIWGGQPGRGTELHFLHYANSRLSGARIRNLFYFGRQLIYILWYSKTTRVTGADRVAVHALPDELSRLTIIITTLVLPLAARWTRELFGNEAGDRQETHLFCQAGKVMTPSKLSYLLSVLTTKHIGLRLGLRRYRHLIIAIQREHLALPNISTPTTNVYQQQAGHTQGVSNRHYAVQTEEKILTGSRAFKTFISASTALHNWFGDVNTGPQSKRRRRAATSNSETDEDNGSKAKGKRLRISRSRDSVVRTNRQNERNLLDMAWDSEEAESDEDADEDVEELDSDYD